jgi:citrate lyase subunit beta/citryl-CoA lyase
VDGVYLDLNDPEGFKRQCEQGSELGFDGKTLIHPQQVEPCNEVFSPAAREIEFSRRVIQAHRDAERQGKGVVLVDGKLIENLHVESARRLVAMAEAIEALAADTKGGYRKTPSVPRLPIVERALESGVSF